MCHMVWWHDMIWWNSRSYSRKMQKTCTRKCISVVSLPGEGRQWGFLDSMISMSVCSFLFFLPFCTLWMVYCHYHGRLLLPRRRMPGKKFHRFHRWSSTTSLLTWWRSDWLRICFFGCGGRHEHNDGKDQGMCERRLHEVTFLKVKSGIGESS